MNYLKDIFSAADFSAAVTAAGRKARETYGLPAVYQLGCIVPDVEQADQQLARWGLSPAMVVSAKIPYWIEDGQSLDYSLTAGFSYHQGVEVELITPGAGSSFHRKDMDEHGEIVLQHLGFQVDTLDAWVDRMTAQGAPLKVRGGGYMGPIKVDFAYFDTVAQVGTVIELISMHVLGVHVMPFARINALIGRYQARSGKRCWRL